MRLLTKPHRRGPACASTKLSIALVLLGGVTCLTGCVSIPAENTTEAIGADELTAHVRFLAQPALKGRKPKTHGSGLARRYIRARFEASGLAPWGQAKRFAQSFGLGTNMVGVLPGADPHLAGEVVVVAAHYDHLGKTERGLCLGAADNASGVAALLEIAESLALRPERPKRSVCFAAFDCEETLTLGAFAFTCRGDFDESTIAGVVNIDMLGRDGFAVLDHHLFVTGTERFPDLRAQIGAHVPKGLTLLPVGTEIAGLRGDHIAFETLDRPVLFFSCGPHEDYHRPSDTPEKLDYDRIRKSVDVIAGAVAAMADSDVRYRRDLSDDGDVEELKAVRLCLVKIRDGHEAMGWTEAQAKQLDPVIEQVEQLLGRQHYSRQDRLQLLRTAAEPLLPLGIWPDSSTDPNDPNQPAKIRLSDSMTVLQTLYTEHRIPFIRAARILVKDLLSQRTGFLLGRAINTTVIVTDVPDHLIFVEDLGPSRYQLEFLYLTLSVGVHINDPARQGVRGNCSVVPTQVEGTREELADYSLLLCRRQPGHSRMWLAVWRHVMGSTVETAYEAALQARLAEGGWADEKAWIRHCTRSGNLHLRHLALATSPRVLGREAEPILLDILADPSAPVTDRQAVAASLGTDSTTGILLAVADMLSDRTQIKHRQQRYLEILTRPGTPFEGYPLWPLVVDSFKKWIDEHGQTPRTMSDFALERLRAVTQHNFGKDTTAWRQWIEANWARRSN